MAHSDAALVALTAAVNTLTDAVTELTLAMQNHTTPWNSSHVHTPHNAVDEFAAPPAAANGVQMQFGLNIASAQARQAMLDCYEQLPYESSAEVQKLHSAIESMMPPMCPRRVARAYDLVLQLDGHIPSRCQKIFRHALLLVREALILVVCGQQKLTKVGFEFGLQCAFQRAISGELRSQLFLAHASVMRHGTNEEHFGAYVQKVHSPPLQPEEVKALFGVYQRCTYLHQLSADWDVTEEKASKKKGKRLGPSERRKAHASNADPAEVLEAQSSPTEWLDDNGRHALV
jgi:hypothetical protein